MTDPLQATRARWREPGSVILREFRAAMQARRTPGAPAFQSPRARSFDAAQASRLTAGWNGSNLSINVLLEQALPLLRGRSRQWARNTGTGRRFLGQVRSGGVGPTGYTLAMRCGDWGREGGGQ